MLSLAIGGTSGVTAGGLFVVVEEAIVAEDVVSGVVTDTDPISVVPASCSIIFNNQ